MCGLTTEQSMIYSVVVYSSPASYAGIAIIGLGQNNGENNKSPHIITPNVENSSVIAAYGTSEAASVEVSIDTEEHITY